MKALFAFAVYVEIDQAEVDKFEEEGGIARVAEQLQKEKMAEDESPGQILGVDAIMLAGEDLETDNPRPALADLGLDLESLGLG